MQWPFHIHLTIRIALVLLAWVGLLLIYPSIFVMFAVLYFVAVCVLMALRLYIATCPGREQRAVVVEQHPFVSIFVATYDEPPELVIQTLRSLLKLEYEPYEIIVLDNNTPDPSVWRPVEAFCQSDPRLHFWHLSPLAGFKAGALNACLERCDDRTEFVLVLDADYQMQPSVITRALQHCSDEKVALVQFPQAYQYLSPSNVGLALEYRHFFDIYMSHANVSDCVVSTGTVSFIRKAALDAIGGWRGDSITEDVEIGLDFYAAGYRGVFVDESVGHGLMPTDFQALRKQRQRWVYGNMQVLSQLLRMPSTTLSPRQRLSAVATLTAWFNLLLIPVLLLLSSLLIGELRDDPLYVQITRLTLMSCWAALLGGALFFWRVGKKGTWRLRDTLASYLVHLGLLWEGNVGWLQFVFGRSLSFERTNKFIEGVDLRLFTPSILIALLLTLSGLWIIVQGQHWLGVLTLSLAPVFLTSLYVATQTAATRHNIVTKEIP